MFIKEVILDGFKSYARRTVVSGFDPKFNAITGLNGSGKSNILDAICFVLGISNLSQVRVRQLQELVYKQGQAGVTKATVSVVFDNGDKSASPVGYEHYEEITIARQVVLNGRNKYLINGHVVQATQVANLFHSVQLNVNNPHFLIMQGRITKVLNMKPPEILGMIEEAAGTRMYETKKQAALKTMDKKQAKVDEINRILAEDITPTLEKLRSEKGHYLEWSAVSAELERLKKFCLAHDFVVARDLVRLGGEAREAMLEEQQRLEASLGAAGEDMRTRRTELEALQERREGDMETAFNAAEELERARAKELVAATSHLTNEEKLLAKAKRAIASRSKEVQEASGALSLKQDALQTVTAELEATTKAAEEAARAAAQAQLVLANLRAGIAEAVDGDSSGGGGSLTERIAQAAAEATQAGTRLAQAELQIEHLATEQKELRAQVRRAEREAGQLQKKRNEAARTLRAAEEKLKGLGLGEERGAPIGAERDALAAQHQRLQEQVERAEGRVAGRLAFEFRSPARDFDRSRVYGLVAKLITVRDVGAASALEVTAGGKLFQVVVDTAATAKALLERGQLRRRVTIIPLDKIDGRRVSAGKLDAAQRVAEKHGARARVAIELLGFDDQVRAAMEFIFGGTLICDDAEAARAMAFHPHVKTRTVTYEGDVFDPSGSMVGGSRGQQGALLQQLHELGARSVELAELQSRMRRMDEATAAAGEIEGEVELLAQQLQLLDEQLGQTKHAALTRRLDEVGEELMAARTAAEAAAQAQETASQRHEALGQEMQRYEDAQQEAETQAGCAVQSTEAALETSEKAQEDAGGRKELLDMEVKVLAEELAALTRQEATGADDLTALEAKIADLQAQRDAKFQAYGEAEATLKEKKAALAEATEAIDALLVGLRAQEDEAGDAQEALRTVGQRLSAQKKGQAEARRRVEQLAQRHAWLETEERFFGQAGTDYDFEAREPEAEKAREKELLRKQEKLGRKINRKVMAMIEQAEEEYGELMRKRGVIEQDKAKIVAVIGDLDVRKNAAVQRTHEKVNRDFGSIFATLLPGTSAKLEPPEGASVLDGLEVKVAFGEIWKESLSELSGGQRSLLALSLILAMLLFKPAPMYILDEVDAALDLSHTQNIGTMLRTHFQASQFIVVSLKEGMFNNANVIFRTRFLEGVSNVLRTLGDGAELNRQQAIEDAENDAASASASAASANARPSAAKGGKRKRGKGGRRGSVAAAMNALS